MSESGTSIVLVVSDEAEVQFASVCDLETNPPEVVACALRLRQKLAAGSVERLMERSAVLPSCLQGGKGSPVRYLINRGPVAFVFSDQGGESSHVIEVAGVFQFVDSVPLAAISG